MYDFGLTDEQFWNITPPQFSALSDRFDQNNRHQDFRTAQVMSMLANCHCRGKDDPPYTPQMFMPEYEGEEAATPTEMTGDEILAHLRAAFPPRPPEDHGG